MSGNGEGNRVNHENASAQPTPQPRISLQWGREFKISDRKSTRLNSSHL